MDDGDVPPFQSREGEDVLLDYIRQPADGDEHIGAEEDGSEFLNESGEGMEVERSVQGQTSTVGEPSQSGVVY
jgi:hypothetical protein